MAVLRKPRWCCCSCALPSNSFSPGSLFLLFFLPGLRWLLRIGFVLGTRKVPISCSMGTFSEREIVFSPGKMNAMLCFQGVGFRPCSLYRNLVRETILIDPNYASFLLIVYNTFFYFRALYAPLFSFRLRADLPHLFSLFHACSSHASPDPFCERKRYALYVRVCVYRHLRKTKNNNCVAKEPHISECEAI